MLSHKQLPKMIIKNFMVNGKVFYYDIKNNIIGFSGPKKIGTGDNFYSDNVEQLLNMEIETNFGKTISIIKEAVENGSSIIINKEMVNSVIKYIDNISFRSNLAFDTVKKESYVDNLFNEEFQRNLLIDMSIKRYDIKNSQYSNNKLLVIINKTNMGYITSRLSYYEVSSNSIKVIIIPITPIIAICLAPPNYDEDNRILIINNDEDILYLNDKAFEYEKEFNGDFIIGNSKEELERIIEKRHIK